MANLRATACRGSCLLKLFRKEVMKMNNSELLEEYGLLPHLIEQIASEVSSIIAKRLTGKDVLRLCQIVFLDDIPQDAPPTLQSSIY